MDGVVRADDRTSRAKVLSIYGAAMAGAGQPQQAVGYLVEVVARYHDRRLLVPATICLSSAAEITFGLGRYDEALAIWRRCLALLRQAPSATGYDRGEVLTGLAKAHLRLGRPRAAVRYATASLATTEPPPDPGRRVHTLQWRGLARLELDDGREAVTDALTAVQIARSSGRAGLELDAVRHLAAVRWLAGDVRAGESLTDADRLAFGRCTDPPVA